jgi:hypothetical protein
VAFALVLIEQTEITVILCFILKIPTIHVRT